MRRAALTAAVLALSATLPAGLFAQSNSVSGSVRGSQGEPIEGVNVFIVETLEGDLTDANGGFGFETAATGPATLALRRFGFIDLDLPIELPLTDLLIIQLEPAPIDLTPIRVQAGAFRLGNLPDVSLTDLDVVTTPGAAADPFRAIQTFPGLQNAGEGAGLYVRGGDVAETRVILDGATVLSPFRLDTDRTVSFGRFDPFLLDGIFFSAGGFGVEYGDALSGITDLTTVGKPVGSALDLTASVAGVSGRVGLDLSDHVGFRATATRTNTGLLMRLNGRHSEFDEVPESTDLSASMVWRYGDAGEIKAFGLYQTDDVGVRIQEPAFQGTFRSDDSADLIGLSGTDAWGDLDIKWGLATSGSRQIDDFGAFLLDRDDRLTQARGRVRYGLGQTITIASGAEFERRASDLAGSVPDRSFDNGPDAPSTVFESRVDGDRVGVFGELELQPSNALRVVAGLRGDRASLTGDWTADPRISTTVRLGESLSVTGAWGIFHQVPDALLFEPTLGDPGLPAMRARHAIAGLTYDEGDRLIRLEAYEKRYRDLAARSRDDRASGGGVGRARGFDVFIKQELGFLGLDGRAAYSFVDSERTDPNTGAVAPAPFDITHTLTLVLNRSFGERVQIGVSYRGATGAPFTPVTGATFDTDRAVWSPVYGSPFSERLGSYSRFDVSANLLHRFWPENLTVLFVSVMNLFDTQNVSRLVYNADYSASSPIRTPFTRTVYFGATTSVPF